MRLFMVDRRDIYSTGDIVLPQRFNNISPIESELVDKLFPCRLTPQGEHYFINNGAMIYGKSVFIDWGLEFYRRGVCPEMSD